MHSTPITRRDFVKTAAATAAVALPLASAVRSLAAEAGAPVGAGPVQLRWLDGRAPALTPGTTLGVPWPRGAHGPNTAFALRTAAGGALPVQTWPLATWPDGSLKWTAHATTADAAGAAELELVPGTAPAAPTQVVSVSETPDAIEIDTGVIRCRVARRGAHVIESIARDGREIARAGRLVALSQNQPESDHAGAVEVAGFTSAIARAIIEQRGPVRAVVRLEGRHAPDASASAHAAWLPFSLRLYFHAGGDAVRIMHSFIFDGDEHKDFVRGLGVRLAVPLRDAPHDRHVRFGGEGSGLFAEAVRGLTGLRRDPGAAVKRAQLAGEACPPVATFPANVRERLQYIPAWGDYTLAQPTAGAFTLRKRTQAGHGWIDIDQGTRAAGAGYIGGPTGGVAFGLRDFWQRHPTQLDIRHAHTDAAEVTLWLWSPEAPPMDLRFYHDGMGMDTFEKQYQGGLDITYEDYEPGYGTPHGIARTSEITLWALAATPPRERFVAIASAVRTPPVLACMPQQYLDAKVFGALWTLPERATPAKAAIEDRLAFNFEFYQRQVEQRHWYGFWHFGDVMHTYDDDRHVWRYDVGGFAWDNSELSPDLWLWYYFLRTGRADVFRFAEAMTRHTGEVDTYHAGRFKGLGTRHNVQHWGCSAKQVRISTAAYRRFYYFLTADERVGDLMRELLDVDERLDAVDPARKLVDAPPKGDYDARVSFGTDWANLAAAWLTEWERGGDLKYRDKLLRGMRDFGAMPLGFFTSERFGYTVATGALEALGLRGRAGNSTEPIRVSHLDSVFGAMEIFAELIQLTAGQPEYEGFARAWLQYCEIYLASADEQTAALGAPLRGTSLQQAHSRLTAYAARARNDPTLAQRAWRDYRRDFRRPGSALVRVEGPTVLNPIDEAPWISTNDAAQWGLAAIQNLALVGDTLPADA